MTCERNVIPRNLKSGLKQKKEAKHVSFDFFYFVGRLVNSSQHYTQI